MTESSDYKEFVKYLGTRPISKPSYNLTIPAEKVPIMTEEDHKEWERMSRRFMELIIADLKRNSANVTKERKNI